MGTSLLSTSRLDLHLQFNMNTMTPLLICQIFLIGLIFNGGSVQGRLDPRCRAENRLSGDLVWVDCANCPKVCGDRPLPCNKKCESGCGCPNGLFRKSRDGEDSNECVNEEDCPQGCVDQESWCRDVVSGPEGGMSQCTKYPCIAGICRKSCRNVNYCFFNKGR